jgi:hypothetical protein
MVANLVFILIHTSTELYIVRSLLSANQNTKFRGANMAKFDCWTTEMRYLGLFIIVDNCDAIERKIL